MYKITQVEVEVEGHVRTFVLNQQVLHRERKDWRGRITRFYTYGSRQMGIEIEGGHCDTLESWIPDLDAFAFFFPLDNGLEIHIECKSINTFSDIGLVADFVEMRDATVKFMVPWEYDEEIREILVKRFIQ